MDIGTFDAVQTVKYHFQSRSISAIEFNKVITRKVIRITASNAKVKRVTCSIAENFVSGR